MPRPPRLELPNGIYHVTQRATDHHVLFVDDFDREAFSNYLGKAVKRYRWKLHAFTQLTNHYHLLVQIREPTLAVGMQFLNSRHVRRFNVRHGRKGTLVQGRYYASLVETEEHYLGCLEYIAMNPVGAGLCAFPEEWVWSSYGGGGDLAPRPDELLRGRVDALLR